jgi:hypothetical protein
MNSMSARIVCRILAVCMAVAPFQAGAGLIGTGDAVAAAQAQRSVPASRAALVGQFEALGISADTARERIAALTDAEVAQLSGQLDSLPAGAVSGLAVGVVIVLAFLLWRFNFSDQAKAERKAAEPAKK